MTAPVAKVTVVIEYVDETITTFTTDGPVGGFSFGVDPRRELEFWPIHEAYRIPASRSYDVTFEFADLAGYTVRHDS